MFDPNTTVGADSRVETLPVYGYILRQLDIADQPPLFLTGWDREFEVAGMPGSYDADDPQPFTPARITHGPLRRESTYDKTTFEINVLTGDMAGISRYALTGAMPRIQVDIIKINPGRVISGDAAEWGQDTILVQTGLMTAFSFQGFNVRIECCPEPLLSGHEIPRWRFSRTCNRQLYGTGCNVNPAAFTLVANIVSMAPQQRILGLSSPHGSEAGNFFRQGVLLHQPTGMRLSVFQSWQSAGIQYVELHQWNPDFAFSDVVTVRAGCRHTLGDCRDKFANAANFGGFSEVPNKNPSAHGI
jgi:hypothetical protein